MNKLDKEQQLDLFWKKFNVFYSFFKEENPNSVGLEAFKSIAFNAFNKKRLGELKKVTAELYGFCRELPKEDKAILKQKVKDELGIDIDEEKRIAKIERILKRGTINSGKEYELLLQRVEEIYDDESKSAVVDKLNELLADYHKKTDKKL